LIKYLSLIKRKNLKQKESLMEQHIEKSEKNLTWLLKQAIETQLELFRHYIEISKLIFNQLLIDEA
jgi:hypothetical protein